MGVNYWYRERIQSHMKEMMQIDSSNTLKARQRGGLYWLWSTTDLTMRILDQLKKETDCEVGYLYKYAYWIALKLKFTNDYIRHIIFDYYKNGVNYAKEVYGQQIYAVMRKYNKCYIEAILKLYEDNDEVNNKQFYDTEHFWRYDFVDERTRGEKIIYSRLHTDNNFKRVEENSYGENKFGNTIEYYPPDDEYSASKLMGRKMTDEEWAALLKMVKESEDE